MAARATAHVALTPPAARRLPRRVRAPPARASVTPASGAARVPASPALAAAQPRPCARVRSPGVPGGAGTGARHRRPRGSVLVGVRGGGSEAEWEEGWRSGAGRGRRGGPRSRELTGAGAENPEAPADVFATVVTEGFGVASARAEGGSEAESFSAESASAKSEPGGKRAWLKKTVWKALSAEDAVFASPPDEIVATLENYPEADGGALNGGMEEELSTRAGVDGEETALDVTTDGDLDPSLGDETTNVAGVAASATDPEEATRGAGSVVAVSEALGSSTASMNGETASAVSSSVSSLVPPVNSDATQTATPTATSEKKKKKDKRYLAVNPPKPYEVMRINAPDASEAPGTHFQQRLTRRALLRDAELTPRDLRRIDPSLLQTNNTPALLVKDQTIMVNLGVRVIVRPDHALLFEPDTDTGRRFLHAVDSSARSTSTQGVVAAGTLGGEALGANALGQNVARFRSADDAESDFDYDLNAAPGGTGGAPIPFELEMVEAALQETMSQLYAKLEFCEERCRRVSSQLRSSINPAVLEELRLTKQSLVALDSRAGAVRQVLLDTLDDDEDIADFTISSTATSEEDKEDEEEEVENLIEYYLQQTETVHNAAEQLLENTRDLEESISVSLSSRRYEVSKLELTLSIATFAAALGALVTGIFGMNLRSCLEMSISAFYLTCFLIVTGIGAIFQSIMRFARKQKIL